MYTQYAFTPNYKYARILSRRHKAVLGFWFGRCEDGSEFAINLIWTFFVWRIRA